MADRQARRGGAYRAAATAGRQRVCDAALAVGAFLWGVRGPFRLCLRRSRDFHRSSSLWPGAGGGRIRRVTMLGWCGEAGTRVHAR